MLFYWRVRHREKESISYTLQGNMTGKDKYRLYDETEGSTVFRAPRKLYRRPRGFHRIRYLYYTIANEMALRISNRTG